MYSVKKLVNPPIKEAIISISFTGVEATRLSEFCDMVKQDYPKQKGMYELKAVFQIKTSLSSIVALLNDVESYPQWVYRCETSKILLKTSEKHLIRYQTIVAPWPVDNRDVVLEVNYSQDEKTKIVYQKVNALPNYAPKVAGHVRIPEFRAIWTLNPLKNGIVEIQYELLVNPGGVIPAWLVNMAMIDGPYDTSLNMKTWLMKEKYQFSNKFMRRIQRLEGKKQPRSPLYKPIRKLFGLFDKI